ncbi:MAG: hypothetical protein NVSMB18_21780 [Acetobacteraceae bacterium]
MVDSSYVLDTPPPASPLKQQFDQVVIPAAINAVGAVEVALERVAAGVRQTPVMAACIALGVGFLIAQRITRRT